MVRSFPNSDNADRRCNKKDRRSLHPTLDKSSVLLADDPNRIVVGFHNA
jgi:hypothetical protein